MSVPWSGSRSSAAEAAASLASIASWGARLGITPVHLDALYYDKDWKPLNQETFASLQRELVTAPRWIIDGNYASTLPIRLEAADTVIFLDLPGWACLRGVAVRRLRHGGYRRLQPDHLGLRPLHPRLPQKHGPSRPRPDHQPRPPGRTGHRSAQPRRRPPLPGRPSRHSTISLPRQLPTMRTDANALPTRPTDIDLSWTCDIPRHLCKSSRTHCYRPGLQLPHARPRTLCLPTYLVCTSDIPRRHAGSVNCGYACGGLTLRPLRAAHLLSRQLVCRT